VVDLGIVLQVEPNFPPIDAIKAHGEARTFDLFHGPERPVLHAHGSLVAQEHHPIAGREGPRAALGLHHLVGAERAGIAHTRPGELIQLRHVGPGVGEHELAGLRPGLAH